MPRIRGLGLAALVGLTVLLPSGAMGRVAPLELIFEGLYGVTFLDSRNGWAVGRDSVILRTDDGGTTWLLQHRSVGPEERTLIAVAFSDPYHGVAVGTKGLVLTTADGGAHWTPTVQMRSDLRSHAQEELEAQKAWFAGHRVVMQEKCDAARSRNRAQNVASSGRGAKGDVSEKKRKEKKGSPTESVGQGAAPPFEIEPTECTSIRVAEEFFEAELAGLEEWANAPPVLLSPSSVENLKFTSVQALGGLDFIAVASGDLLRSDDGGLTWTTLPNEPQRARSGWFADARRGWAVGFAGYVGRTDDGGQSWLELSIPEPRTLGAAFFRDERTGWVGGESGVLFATADGGESWRKLPTGIDQSIRDIRFLDERVGFLITWNGVWHTTDGGAAWSPVPLPEDAAEWSAPAQIEMPVPLSVSSLGPSSAVVVGTWGLVLRTDDGAETWHELRSLVKAQTEALVARLDLLRSSWGVDLEVGYVQPVGGIYDRFGPGIALGLDVLALRGRVKIGTGFRMHLTVFRERINAPSGEVEEGDSLRLDGSGLYILVPAIARIVLWQRGNVALLGSLGAGFVYHGFNMAKVSSDRLDDDSGYKRRRMGFGAMQALALARLAPNAGGLKRSFSKIGIYLEIGIQESWTRNTDGIQTDLGRKDHREFGIELWPFLTVGIAAYE